jgi:hypothetical protein
MNRAVLLLHAGKAVVPYSWLINSTGLFCAVAVVMLLFILLYLHRWRKQTRKKAQLRRLFSDLIAETIICESPEEVTKSLQQFLEGNANLLTKPFVRKVLSREIVRTSESISGLAADNLCMLFEQLNLDKDCLQRFASSQWHRKASAIKDLAAMQQSRYLVKIYRETNNAHNLIRTEAQLAVVKLTGFKGLRFLTIVSRPLSQWQQLSLLNHLQEGDIEEENIRLWLSSGNDSVVEFALRLVEIFKCYDLHTETVGCLQHASALVRLQALQTLKEIPNETTAAALMLQFPQATKQEQLEILSVLNETETNTGLINFLTSLLHHADEAIRFRAIEALQRISPVWSMKVIKEIKTNPSFTYILSFLDKQAV